MMMMMMMMMMMIMIQHGEVKRRRKKTHPKQDANRKGQGSEWHAVSLLRKWQFLTFSNTPT